MLSPSVFVVGRFPPPRDGQALATERLAALLDRQHHVGRVRVTAPEGAFAETRAPLSLGRVRHYLGTRAAARAALAAAPEAPVLWPSVSPTPLGHARDLLTVVPAFGADRAVYAVVHRGDFEALFRSPLTRATGQRLVERLRGVVFLSERLAARCAPWIPEAKRLVIPNTIDEAVRCSAADVAAKQDRGPRTPFRLLFLSNMIPAKGWLDVLDAVARLRAEGVPVEADFAGRWHAPEGEATFMRIVDRHDLHGAVTHHGALHDPTALRALYLAADAFLLPTYYPTEAQPLTILEALNAGTPVIATAHAGIPDVLRDGREGLLVPPRDPDALARAVLRLRDPETWRAASLAARARFEAAFSPTAVGAHWGRLLAPSL